MAHTESSVNTTATLTIDGQQVTVPAGTTILNAARKLGIQIPTLCWLEKYPPPAPAGSAPWKSKG